LTGQPVSVVLTVLNEAGGIARLLDDLLGQDAPPDEIVVVDGGSTDGTQVIAGRYSAASRVGGEDAPRHPEVRLVAAPGANISQGRNRGITEARNELIAVTDAGVRLDRDWLRLITQPLLDGTADVVAGFFQPDPHSPFETAMGATVLPALEDVDPAAFLPSSRSIAFRRDVWRRVEGYPEWLDYCEDLIFDLNIRAAGVRLAFEPRAAAHFRPRSSLRAFFRQYYRYARGDGKADLWRKRHAFRYATYLHLLATLACLASPRGRRHRVAVAYFTLTSLLGALAYCAKPVRRLTRQISPLPPRRERGRVRELRHWLLMLALIPVIRVTGDAAKMAGYPAGWLWRLRHKPGDWRR
jgi:glycosyltransferase involved in cell wall biosynthesis